VFAEEEAALLLDASMDAEHLEELAQERVAGLPLEHVLGWVAFCGMRIAVDREIFVPRRRTELLVHEGLRLLGGRERERSQRDVRRQHAVELCCGAASVATALAASTDGVTVHAADIDTRAVAVARRNLEPYRGHTYAGDLYDALPPHLAGKVDLLVANAPYVPTRVIATMPAEARLHEPWIALDGGVDGLSVQRRLVAGAGCWLKAGGHLLVESSRQQAHALSAEMHGHGLTTRIVTDDDLDATAVVGTAPD
jgi:release factor glutamine methyltransferase